MWSCNVRFMSSCVFVLYNSVQSWTERAKGQTGDDLKKRKRGGGGVGDETGPAEADENSAKKKKSLDPSAKLSAFAFKS